MIDLGPVGKGADNGIQRTSDSKMYRVIHQIEIYLVGSAMQPFNNRQVCTFYTQKGATTSGMAKYVKDFVSLIKLIMHL